MKKDSVPVEQNASTNMKQNKNEKFVLPIKEDFVQWVKTNVTEDTLNIHTCVHNFEQTYNVTIYCDVITHIHYVINQHINILKLFKVE